MKIVSVVGARPQFIKAAVVSRALRRMESMTEVLVHTGQHYDENMSDIFFEELEIPAPNHHLGIGSLGHGAQTGRMLEAIEAVLQRETPAAVLVYGDTNSTLAGALAAAKLDIPVAHVEAGLRSFRRSMPEEINRVVADHLSELLFAPTQVAVNNLSREGIAGAKVRLVGDVMYDAALYYAQRAEQVSTVLTHLQLNRGHYVLATVHRAENTDDPERLHTIFGALGRLSSDLQVVVPLHPRTRRALETARIREPGVTFIDPVGYLDMVMLEKHARLIATDSGGVQKEAYFYRVPCATLRDETEWVELIEAGWNTLVPPRGEQAVYRRLQDLLRRPLPDAERSELYGTGAAGVQIAHHLSEMVATGT